MAVAISSRSSERTRRTMFSSATSNDRPRLTSRMTRPNSVEIGGRDSRTTSSTAWRNEEPARRALAIRVIVSGSCLLNDLRRPDLRRPSQKRGSMNPISSPTMRNSGLRRVGSTTDSIEHRQRDADRGRGPDDEVLGRLEPQVGAGDLARQVGAEVALLDDLVELGQRLARLERLGDALAAPGRLGLLLARGRIARKARVDVRAAAGHRDAERDQEDREGRDGGDDDGHRVHELGLPVPASSWRRTGPAAGGCPGPRTSRRTWAGCRSA